SGITYQNTNTDNPTAGDRTFTLTQLQDSGGTANGGADTAALSIISVVDVQPTDDAPTVTTSAGTTASSEQIPIAIDTGLTLTDPDNSTFGLATVGFTANFHSGEDLLAFVNDGTTMGNIAASYNSGTGVLTLTSAGATATLAQWQAALHAVTYDDSSATPNAANRTISFTVNDGTSDSNIGTKTISLGQPVVTTSAGTTAASEQTPIAIDTGLTVSD